VGAVAVRAGGKMQGKRDSTSSGVPSSMGKLQHRRGFAGGSGNLTGEAARGMRTGFFDQSTNLGWQSRNRL